MMQGMIGASMMQIHEVIHTGANLPLYIVLTTQERSR